MTRAERIDEWVRFYKASQPSYRAFALVAVEKNTPELLSDVIKKLGLTVEGLIKEMGK